MDELKELHNRKSNDYAQEGNPFSNFERAAYLGSWFNDPVDRVFAILFGIKLARLAELSNGKDPLNESIDDTMKDLACYAGLWCAFIRNQADMLPDSEPVTVSYDELNPIFQNGLDKEQLYQCPYCRTNPRTVHNFSHDELINHMMNIHSEKYETQIRQFFPSRIGIITCEIKG